MKQRTAIIALLLAVISADGTGTVLNVPAQYASIQAAIDASSHGDTVLVAPGTYLENITFRNKNIVVASRYLLTRDPATIFATIIDGSAPANPDSASCVRIIGGQDTTAVLEGFTLTRGSGTKWLDEHGAGLYREGGGILAALSSPTIKNNYLIENEAVNSTGCVSAGGGAMRLGDGSPRVLNNVLALNRAMYGGGIVLNYCSDAIVRNTIVVRNKVYQAVPGAATFGGGGIWINSALPGNPKANVIENTTIVGNSSYGEGSGSAGRGGGIYLLTADAIGRNNIVWDNVQASGGEINGSIALSYSCIQGGFAGTGNIDALPEFVETGFTLKASSPCIDAGDPGAAMNDPENTAQPGSALLPSMGTIRNDMGAFGGPLARILPEYRDAGIETPAGPFDFGLLLPGGTSEISIPVASVGGTSLTVDSIAFVRNEGQALQAMTRLPLQLEKGTSGQLSIQWSPATSFLLDDTLLIYHNDPHTARPLKTALAGSSIPTPLLAMNTAEHNFGSVDVNVLSRDTTFYVYNVGTAEDSATMSIDPKGVNPPTALSVTPGSGYLGTGDSLAVTFTFRPRDIIKAGLGNYAPVVQVESRGGGTVLQKVMRFRLTGTVSVEDPSGAPSTFALEQNYPNPFNPTTTIRYRVPALTGAGRQSEDASGAVVRLVVYDALGREVAVLVNERKEPGSYEVPFPAGNNPATGGNPGGFASGVYLYRLTAGDFVESRVMVLVK